MHRLQKIIYYINIINGSGEKNRKSEVAEKIRKQCNAKLMETKAIKSVN